MVIIDPDLVEAIPYADRSKMTERLRKMLVEKGIKWSDETTREIHKDGTIYVERTRFTIGGYECLCSYGWAEFVETPIPGPVTYGWPEEFYVHYDHPRYMDRSADIALIGKLIDQESA